jgi:hypothetical protein
MGGDQVWDFTEQTAPRAATGLALWDLAHMSGLTPMSAALDHLKSFLLRHGVAPFVEETAAAVAGRPDAEAHLRIVQATERIEMELRGISPITAKGLATGFAALVRKRAARGAR